jgi:hypothetical protein
MSLTQVLSGLDILQERKDIMKYIKEFNGNGGFMYSIETDPERIKLKDDMEKLLDDGSHSGASWGWMMRVIQSVLNGNVTREEIIIEINKQEEEYRIRQLKRIEELEKLEKEAVYCREWESNNNDNAQVYVCEASVCEASVCEASVCEASVCEANVCEAQQEPASIEKETSVEPIQVPEEPVSVIVKEESNCSAKEKPYRACIYDVYDRMYADLMKSLEYPEEFNTFTQGLMNESSINRYSLLSAIDDYNNSNSGPPLSVAFKNNAFNYRPYQSW